MTGYVVVNVNNQTQLYVVFIVNICAAQQTNPVIGCVHIECDFCAAQQTNPVISYICIECDFDARSTT